MHESTAFVQNYTVPGDSLFGYRDFSQYLTIPTISKICLNDVLSQLLTFSTLWKVLIILVLLSNLKTIPFMWHIRIINAFRFCMRSQRSHIPVTPAHLFQPLITTSHAPLMEIDFQMHKTNSSYFSDVDVARTHLFCTLFSKGMEKMRGTSGAISRKKEMFGIALGAVSCSFKKELKPYEEYEMWTRVLSWDEKWIYIVTHFVGKDSAEPESYTLYPQQESRRGSATSSASVTRSNSSSFLSGEGKKMSLEQESCLGSKKSVIHGTALSRCVFKQGRKTVAPEELLRISGLLVPTSFPADANAASITEAEDWTAERIEEERLRGYEIAKQLARESQEDLEQEFSGDSEALGRHSDGSGLMGVISTLAQLAHLKKDQIL